MHRSPYLIAYASIYFPFVLFQSKPYVRSKTLSTIRNRVFTLDAVTEIPAFLFGLLVLALLSLRWFMTNTEMSSTLDGANNEETPSEPPEITTACKRSTLYPKIYRLGDLIFRLKKLPEYREASTSIALIGSTKLHGTHADIVFESATSEEFRLQSRNQLDLKAGKGDNAGFAAWVADLGEQRGTFLQLRNRFLSRYHKLNPGQDVEGEIIIAAEWCGAGIQKKVAIVNIRRFLAIVSVFINGVCVPDWGYADIEDEENRIFNVGRAGYFRCELRLDDEGLAESLAQITKMTKEVETQCPFAKQVFLESGIGEGIVWKVKEKCGDAEFWFKSKGALHEVSNVSRMPASAFDIENSERIEKFARAVVTENRLEQGWDLLLPKNNSGLGAFLKWVMDDCMVEERLEMENLGISKNKLGPIIVAIAKPWYFKRLAQPSVA